MPVLNVDMLIENRVNAINSYHKETGIQRAQLDVSGGVDSAVMLGLLAKAVGPENITAVYSNINSSEDSAKRAQETADVFDVKLVSLDLNYNFDELYLTCLDQMLRSQGTYLKKDIKSDIEKRMATDPTILGSFRSCIRAPIGRFMNRLAGNGIRHGTGNECEDRWLRFYQKGGDGEVDTNPISMLSKGEVFQLAVGLGVPMSVLSATPSPDLQGVGEAGHNDEDELKALTGVDWTYSKVNPNTGEYTSVGTIERMSRHLDEFEQTEIQWASGRDWEQAVKENFSDMKEGEFKLYFDSYKSIEASTRHKMNPNIPCLGFGREDLLEIGAITNELPL